jgi:hypothetical protein
MRATAPADRAAAHAAARSCRRARQPQRGPARQWRHIDQQRDEAAQTPPPATVAPPLARVRGEGLRLGGRRAQRRQRGLGGALGVLQRQRDTLAGERVEESRRVADQ